MFVKTETGNFCASKLDEDAQLHKSTGLLRTQSRNTHDVHVISYALAVHKRQHVHRASGVETTVGNQHEEKKT